MEITELFYVQDHYEVRFNDGTDDYTAQYFARKGSITEEGIQEHVDAYMNNEQSGISGVQKVPVSVEPEPISEEELARLALEANVDKLKGEKDALSKDLEVGYAKAKQLNEAKEFMSVENYDNAMATLKIYIDGYMPLFLAKYDEYVTERTKRDTL